MHPNFTLVQQCILHIFVKYQISEFTLVLFAFVMYFGKKYHTKRSFQTNLYEDLSKPILAKTSQTKPICAKTSQTKPLRAKTSQTKYLRRPQTSTIISQTKPLPRPSKPNINEDLPNPTFTLEKPNIYKDLPSQISKETFQTKPLR